MAIKKLESLRFVVENKTFGETYVNKTSKIEFDFGDDGVFKLSTENSGAGKVGRGQETFFKNCLSEVAVGERDVFEVAVNEGGFGETTMVKGTTREVEGFGFKFRVAFELLKNSVGQESRNEF